MTSASYRAVNPEASRSQAYRSDIFHYDALGNREGSNYVASLGTLNFNQRNNGLNQYAAWMPYSPIFYDDHYYVSGAGPANGVLTENGWTTASYNALNQPVGMWSPAYPGGASPQIVWFGHDPLGRCVKRWVGPNNRPPANVNPATYYYYDGWSLVQEGSSASSPERIYVHGGRVDEIVASQAGGVWNYHQFDARGHCILLTDTGGNILEQYDYDAFGRPYFFSSTGQPLNSSTFGNRFLFTGREWLRDLRVYDYRNRMYHPELGRFLQPDPVHFGAGDYNLYRYCHNDPINKSDPMGLDTYSQNRDFEALGGAVHWTSNYENPTHTFVFTTNPDGSIAHTYSWGNTENQRGWNQDTPLDRRAAEQARTVPRLLQSKVGDSTLDPYIQKAYDALNQKENEHQNGGIVGNCKSEAKKLLNLARKLQKQDQDAQRQKEKEKLNRTEVRSNKS